MIATLLLLSLWPYSFPYISLSSVSFILVLPVEEQESAIRFYGGCRSGVMVVTNLIMVRWRGKRKSSGVFTKLPFF
jgi:hypothetical protein